MKSFPVGHASDSQWEKAASRVLTQLRTQLSSPSHAASPTLGLVYLSDHHAASAQELLDFFSAELPQVTDWSGTVGVGVCANHLEYFDEPGLVVMLLDVPAEHYRVFSGVSPLPAHVPSESAGFRAHTALVHADGSTPELAELLDEMAARTTTGYLFGGLTASRSDSVQLAVAGNGNLAGQGRAGGVFRGGLSGVAWDASVTLISRVTQGCQPIGVLHTVTKAYDNVVLELDGDPALDVLLRTLGVELVDDPQHALNRVRATLAGLVDAGEQAGGLAHTGHFGTDTRVRHIVGLDGARRGVALADQVEQGMRLAFCQRNAAAARADLVRICSEIREELAPLPLEPPVPEAAAPQVAPDRADDAARWAMPSRSASAAMDMSATPAWEPAPASRGARHIVGAVYVSCSGRGGPHFGGPSAEMQLVRHALGEVPLVGFFAAGEIARHHLYGYTGVLTVFVADAQARA